MAARKLSPKQSAFVDEYLVDLNASAAYRRAGYSPKNANVDGPKLLANPRIAEEVRKRMDARAERLGVTQDDVVRALRGIAFADLRDVSVWGRERDDEGYEHVFVRLRSSAEIPDEVATALSELRFDASGHLIVRLHDKLRALELLGRHLGMFKKDVDVKVSVGITLDKLHELAASAEVEMQTVAEDEAPADA